ncbi:copper amine oxidase N-terminal domain-containing protein [Bacillus horti]|uniref:Copper amine oxidase-like N-terminal domain-containing protein n=1 Tax=Caldalkalibacillus horti TaxID=77523 RepID=A0ABT9VVH2_9BACI|nr:copper amine oxidase N-terminal domain-containing protein [Bacillus horti]MDQ0164969.1 hypothetical protein [Bacillus horti]
MKRKVAVFTLAIMLVVSALAGSIFAANTIQLVVNGKFVKTDVAPLITQGRVMVPIRFVSEALGYNIQWDQGKKQVSIDREVWKEPIQDGDKLELRGAANTVSSYLVLLQSVYDPTLNDPTDYQRLITGNNEIFMPSYGGSSLNYIPSYEILDGRLVRSNQEVTAEIAASYWLLTTTEQRYTKYTKVYTLKKEIVDGTSVWLIDSETTINTETYEEMPAKLHAPFE